MIHIAGGIVWNPNLGVAVVNQNNNSWSLPKGHIEEGESPLIAAIREIEEETGISKDELALLRPIGSYERNQTPLHPDDTPEPREITMFLFQTNQKKLSPKDPENPEAHFVPIGKVSELLTHPKDKEFFEEFRKNAPEWAKPA